jgi:hypothetical protein
MMRRLALGMVLLAPAGCIGSLGGDDDSTGKPGEEEVTYETSAFACKPGLQPTELPLRRLSNQQYRRAMTDTLRALLPGEADAVLSEVQSRVDALPRDKRSGPDPKYGGFRRLDQAIFQETVSGSYEVGSLIGSAVASSDARLQEIAGACATDADASNDAACLEAFVEKVAPRILRRAVSAEDVAFYVAVADSTLEREDYGDVLNVLFSAPDFLYFVEQGSGEPVDGVLTLTAHELANRLSFHFWQTVPDEELWALADAGSLSDEAVYKAQVERLFADARTQQALDEFYGDWLDPQHLGALDAGVGSPDYDAFTGEFSPSSDTRAHMLNEIERMGRYYSVDAPSSFDEFFLSDRSFAEHDDVAEIYGVSAWTEGDPPALPAERQGLTTRALLLASGSVSTHPIMKGVFLRKTILCDEVGAPPADAMAVADGTQPSGITSRDKAVAISEARADCAACHETLINPLGFVTENFDGLGRLRSSESVYDKTTGEVIGTAAVDTSATPRVTFDDEREASNAAQLNSYMLESEKPQACFARRYFRFTFGREEDAGDGCLLADTHEALLDGGDLGSVLRSMALAGQFKNKSFTP